MGEALRLYYSFHLSLLFPSLSSLSISLFLFLMPNLPAELYIYKKIINSRFPKNIISELALVRCENMQILYIWYIWEIA